MKLVDVFMFDDEFEMLDCRLYQLAGLVDRVILIEGDRTMSGEPKPYHFSERADHYAAFPIEVVRVEMADVSDVSVANHAWTMPTTMDAWRRDARQRDAAKSLLETLNQTDIVIYGDLDEIPKREIIEAYPDAAGRGPAMLLLDMLVYSTALRHPTPWAGPIIGRVGDVGVSVPFIRDRRWGFPAIPEAGWHLTWFGSPQDRIRKMRHFAHQELRETVGDDIGIKYPSEQRHVDGKQNLEEWSGPLPTWIEDGWAPPDWTKVW